MIDRGTSDDYLIWWFDNAYPGDSYDLARHVDNGLRSAAYMARRGGKRCTFDIYDSYRTSCSVPLAAEALRRALWELADPAPVDDSLPPPGSRVWDFVFEPLWIRFPRRR